MALLKLNRQPRQSIVVDHMKPKEASSRNAAPERLMFAAANGQLSPLPGSDG